MAGTLYPPIPAAMVGENGKITREWSQFFVSLMAQIGPLTAITDLTGDVTAAGPGSAVATIAPGVIVNADVNAAAAIAWSKLDTAGQVVNASVNASAGIDLSKLASQAARTIVANATAGAAVPTAVAGNLGASVAYTPTWTAITTNPVLNDGTLTGTSIDIGKLTFWTLNLTMGASTTYGTGLWLFTLPTAAVSSRNAMWMGQAYDSSTTGRYVAGAVQSSTTVFYGVTLAAPASGYEPTVPFTWAASDQLTFSGVYERA